MLPGVTIFNPYSKAINNDGVEGDAENTLTIVIDPPIWGTLWAKILYALLAIGAVIMVFYVVRRSERKRYTEKRREETARKTGIVEVIFHLDIDKTAVDTHPHRMGGVLLHSKYVRTWHVVKHRLTPLLGVLPRMTRPLPDLRATI